MLYQSFSRASVTKCQVLGRSPVGPAQDYRGCPVSLSNNVMSVTVGDGTVDGQTTPLFETPRRALVGRTRSIQRVVLSFVRLGLPAVHLCNETRTPFFATFLPYVHSNRSQTPRRFGDTNQVFAYSVVAGDVRQTKVQNLMGTIVTSGPPIQGYTVRANVKLDHAIVNSSEMSRHFRITPRSFDRFRCCNVELIAHSCFLEWGLQLWTSDVRACGRSWEAEL